MDAKAPTTDVIPTPVHPTEQGLDMPPEFTKFPVKQRRFLMKYAECGTITHAARYAHISRPTVLKWRKHDLAFIECFDLAQEMCCDSLEAEVRRRAYEGVLEPVWHQGRRVGVVRKYADTLLMFLLKGLRPNKFRDNVTLNANVSGGVLLIPVPRGTEQWKQLANGGADHGNGST